MSSSDHSRAPSGGAWPYVSVVMPVRNEGAFIARSLGAVLAQDYPADRLEVLVVDGQSTDKTRAHVRALANGPVPVRLLDNPRRIVPTAMNIGIKNARGAIIVRVDGHTIIAPDYVRRAVLALRRTGAHNVGGLMRPVPTGYISRAIAAATSSPFGVGGGAFHYAEREQETDTVYMGVYPKWVLEHLGLYDEEFVRNQDDELNYRLRAAGGRIVLCPELRSAYYPRSTFWKLAKQYFQYGWWKVRVLQKHPRQMRRSHFAPGAFVLALIVGAIGAIWWQTAGWFLAGVLGAWFAAALVASVLAGRRFGWRTVPILPLTFFTLHASYGLGFLTGLIRFAGRWKTSRAQMVRPLPKDLPAWSLIETAPSAE